MLLQTHYFSVYLEKHQQNKLWMTSGIQGMLMALESLFHVVSVGDITSSLCCPQWEPITRKKQRNEFIHDITVRLPPSYQI